MVYIPLSTIRYEYSSESEKNVKTTKVNNTIIIKYRVNKYGFQWIHPPGAFIRVSVWKLQYFGDYRPASRPYISSDFEPIVLTGASHARALMSTWLMTVLPHFSIHKITMHRIIITSLDITITLATSTDTHVQDICQKSSKYFLLFLVYGIQATFFPKRLK